MGRLIERSILRKQYEKFCEAWKNEKFYQRIADDLSAELKIRKQDVFISLVEVSKENWSFGNGEMQYGPV